ncbi:MAG: cytochrome c oxidase assembly protein [Phyllobacteriaceae bacterium]|nr:cytochrome c oxidase assembly protein [Phyllobacteriaceae bacterium]
MTAPAAPAKRLPNLAIAAACLAFFGGMVGMSYAAVPLYQLFCQVTGYGGTTQRAEQAPSVILDRTVKVHFDTTVASGLPWSFQPVKREVTIRIGETAEVAFVAKNQSAAPIVGRAAFNVTPHYAGSFFNKLECFCFTDMTVKPGEELTLPVVFFVDPAIVDQPEFKGLTSITLSYTFYPGKDDKPVAAAPAGTETNTPKLGG